MIRSSFNDNNYCDFIDDYNLDVISQGNLSYWCVKIYNIDINDMIYKNYQLAKDNILQSIKVNDYLHIFQKYTVLAVDGTVINSAIDNLNGKNVCSLTISSLLDISNNMFYDYLIAFDNNETKTLLKQPLNKNQLIIMDRGYSDISFLKIINKRVNFIVRLKKNLLMYKSFMKKNISSDIINIDGMRIKLVKYHVDKKTKKVIIKKYEEDNNKKNEDDDSLYVIATNVIDLTIDECIYLYKKRWSVEVAFKHLKSNFKLKYICKETNINDPVKKNKFWIDLSFLMYSMTTMIKNEIDNDITRKNCKYSKCASFIRKMLLNENNNISKLIVKLLKIKKRYQNNNKPNQNLTVNIRGKRGRYKSFSTIVGKNILFLLSKNDIT